MLEINFKYNNKSYPIKYDLNNKIKDICVNFTEKNPLK